MPNIRIFSGTTALAGGIVFLVLAAGLMAPLKAQTGTPRSRIRQAISDTAVVRLGNSTHPRIRTAIDRGRIAGDSPMGRVILMLKSSSEQEADLQQLLLLQQDPSSSQYHHWLTPQEFGERFGASDQEITAINGWLSSHGFHVDKVANGRREIEFSGTVRQIEDAFHTELHQYDSNGEIHLANALDISIPEALTPVVAGVVSLNDFFSQSMAAQITPQATLANGAHVMLPYDFATIYDVAPLWNQGIDGTGQSIAIVGRSNINLNDIATFRSAVGLPVNTPQVILDGPDPGLVKGDETEADLDVEWSGAVAKAATIKFVAAANSSASDGVDLAARYVVDNNVAPVVSVSFGGCELSATASIAQHFSGLWQQAASQGMSVFVSTGDTGSAGCDKGSVSTALGGLSVNVIASSPYNVAVGGTQFNENGADSVFWNGTNDPSNGSSAKSYIPEVVWNESSSRGLASGGGGVSIFNATPSWQTGNGVPTADPGTSTAHHRYLPDVSLTAAGHDGYAIVSEGQFPVVFGTSASSPSFAGIMALINQAGHGPNGNPNPRLYAIAAAVPSAFHDVITGSNAVPCATGTPNCLGGMLTGYSAGPGYDLATGWGSVDAYALVHAWSGSAPAAQPLSITSSSPLGLGQTGTAYSQTLAATGGTPPYSWSVLSGTLPSGLSLSSSGAISGTPTTAGSYTFTVQVADSTHATASQVFQLTITGATSSGGSSSSPTANRYHVFPQFADGMLGDGSFYRTTLMISNPSTSASATCTLQLRGLTVSGFALGYSVGVSSWAIASTSGTQPFQSGYATLQCSSSVEAQLLYSYYDRSGLKLSEATVFSSPPASAAQVLGDNRGGAQIAIAFANDSDQSGTYTITVVDSAGNSVGSVNKTLQGRSSYASFVNDLVTLPADYYGQILVSSKDNVASLIGLRYTGNAFTTIPAIVRSSVAATANTYHVFPQFTDGQLSDGSYYHTTVLITNPSTGSGTCTLRLYGLTVNGSNEFTYTNVSPGSWADTTSISSMQSIKSGYATLSCAMPVEAQLLYSFYSSTGTKISEATVFSSPSSATPQVLADDRQGSTLAVAIANDSDQVTSYTINAYDANGSPVSTATRQIAARTSLAAFLTDVFPALPSNYLGKVVVSSATGTASIIGLRFTGNTFTTIPETVVAAPAAPAPTLASINPSAGNAGTTVTATLTGTNFVAGGTTVQISGTGITVGSPQVSSATSLTVSFTISASAAVGTRTVTVATSGGMSNGLSFGVIIPTTAPTLSSVSPSSGTTGSSVTVTITGTNFVSGGTTVAISGTGISVGTPQIVGSTSLSVGLTIASTATIGNRTITVTTTGGTSNGVVFNVVASTSKPFNETQTERLIGSWTFNWKILSTFTESFKLNNVQASPVIAGDWNIFGTDQYGSLVLAGYSSLLQEFDLYDPGSIVDEFFVFDFTGPNTVAGCYYLISPAGSTNLSDCYPMTGIQTATTAINVVSNIKSSSDLRNLRKAEVEQLEPSYQPPNGRLNEVLGILRKEAFAGGPQ